MLSPAAGKELRTSGAGEEQKKELLVHGRLPKKAPSTIFEEACEESVMGTHRSLLKGSTRERRSSEYKVSQRSL